MTGQEIVAKVKELRLPAGSYVVFGSCPMAIAGIRESTDIDMLVSEELFTTLKQTGWQMIHKGVNDKPLIHEVFEAHKSWRFSAYSPTLEHLLASATIVDAVPFASLEEVRKWKAASDNPKHQEDVKLIDNYFANQA